MNTSSFKRLAFAILVLQSAAACTQNRQPNVDVRPTQKNGAELPGNKGASRSESSSANEEAAIKTIIPKASFASYGLDLTNLTYGFTFLSVEKSDKLTFVGEEATINISGLPSGKSGEMALVILENGKEKFKATKTVTLNKGSNSLELVLRPTGASSGGTGGSGGGNDANAEIRVKIEDQSKEDKAKEDERKKREEEQKRKEEEDKKKKEDSDTAKDEETFKWDGKSNQGNKAWSIEVVK